MFKRCWGLLAWMLCPRFGYGGGSWNQSGSRSNSYSSSAPLSPSEVGGYFRYMDKLTGGGKVKTTDPATGKTAKVYQPGQLGTFAKNGSPTVDYQGVDTPQQYFSTDLSYSPAAADVGYHGASDDQIKALGGLGASRTYAANRARKQAIDEITADAGLTLAQSQRSRQLTDQDYADRLDAIQQESEAAITQAAMDRAAEDMSGRQAQATFDAEQRAKEYAGRTATAGQQQALAAFLQTEAGRAYEAAVANGQKTRQDLLAVAEMFFGGKGQTSTSSATSKASGFGFSAQGGVGLGGGS
jgi:hypothetical protein